MKAAVCYAFNQPLAVEEVELAGPEAGELTVRLAACAICHSDIHFIEGAWGGDLPAVYGHEAAGVVEATGAGVTRAEPGDHVVVSLLRFCGSCRFCTRGQPYLCDASFRLDRERPLRSRSGQAITQGLGTAAFGERVLVHESQVVPVPPDLPLDRAALLACGVITGLGAVVNTAAVPAGSSVVVIGTGGVGLNSVQGAVLRGAHPIVALDLSDRKLEAAKVFGATHTLNPGREDARAGVRALTQGRGADYVFVAVGSAQAIEQGLELLARGGTLVIVGMPPTGARAALEATDLAYYGQRILGSHMGSTRLQVDVPWLVELYRAGRLRLDELISARYPLEEINAAIAEVRRGEALRNVIVLDAAALA